MLLKILRNPNWKAATSTMLWKMADERGAMVTTARMRQQAQMMEKEKEREIMRLGRLECGWWEKECGC